MKKVFTILLAVCCVQIASSQNDTIPKTAFTKMYLPVWIEATEHCMDVAKAMPEEKYGYKPTEVSKTFAEQMVHIAAANKLITNRYVLGMDVKPNTPDASKFTKVEILEMMMESFEYTKQIIMTVEQEQLDETCKMYHSGNIVSRAFALFFTQDHLANHRAKSNLYLRMNGVEPPEYTW
ncbi:DinB family protein [Maribacter algarum]|uniref:DinB family protein n=1 Tax=Maribacter algarum (ex Zhang et al. 2020) TaxID=2578118 RepID=A0A5S3PVL0_9FLAO|nr:DinB family protein [Maribacter algarum]TMM59015.1 DinB family protein [Maribacter algarum]